MRRLFQILFMMIVLSIPALASANSVEYLFDDTFFSGSYSPEYYAPADLHFNRNSNDFGGKIFFQDLKSIELTQLDMDGGGQLYCLKQLRGFYVNPVRGNRVRPLDEDSLNYLKTVDDSYDTLTMTGGFFICGNSDNGVYGYIEHSWSGETYRMIAGSEYAFDDNTIITGDRSYNGTFLFENNTTTGYLRDSYGGIAQIDGFGLDVYLVCGDSTIDAGETCDDGVNNGLIKGGCNATCNGLVANICGNGEVELPETCDEGSGVNGTVGYCNISCNGIVPQPDDDDDGGCSGGGCGGGSLCAGVICSINPNPQCCPVVGGLTGETLTGKTLTGEHTAAPTCTYYTPELNEAFSFAYTYGITTVTNCKNANLEGGLIRKHAAKMISEFAIKIMKKVPDTTRNCIFFDVTKESDEMQFYMKTACQLGLMGLKSDGTPDLTFNPNGKVSRAQFGTMLSRLIYGNQYNVSLKESVPWYSRHLQALKAAEVMTKISNPAMLELRGYVMLMMMRINQKSPDNVVDGGINALLNE